MFQLIWGASILLTNQKSAFADDGDDDGYDDEDYEPIISLNPTSPNGQNIILSKPNKTKGRVLNQDEVRAAIASEKAATLPLLLAYLKSKYPGKVLDVKMRQSEDNLVYEVKLLSKAVFLRTLLLDAKTLALL